MCSFARFRQRRPIVVSEPGREEVCGKEDKGRVLLNGGEEGTVGVCGCCPYPVAVRLIEERIVSKVRPNVYGEEVEGCHTLVGVLPEDSYCLRSGIVGLVDFCRLNAIFIRATRVKIKNSKTVVRAGLSR